MTAHLSRRGFLKTSALVVAGACVARAAANERIGIGMIGMGRQATYANLPPFLNNPHTQVLAVCDVDSWRLANAKSLVEKFYAGKAASGSYKGCAAYRDFREILARPDIDAVMISTPDHWHVPMAIAAAQAGKDIACEKPLTHSIAEGRALADAVKRYGRMFRTDSEVRSSAVMHRAVELVRNGRIGKLVRIETGVPRGDVPGGKVDPMPVPGELDYPMWLGPAPEKPYTLDRVHPRQSLDRPGWMRCSDTCYGMVTNWGTHLNDIAQWGNNSEETGPVEIEGKGSFATGGLWDICIDFDLRYKYASGVELHYHIDHPYIRFEGTDGWIHANWLPDSLSASNDAILRQPLRETDVRFPLKTEKQDFIDAVRTRTRTLADAEVGHRTTSLCHLGYIAVALGRKMKWDPQAERFIGDATADRMCHRPTKPPWGI